MTKADLADKIHEHLYYRNGSTKKECSDLTDLVFEVMNRAIVEEGKLKVASFGNFEVKQKRTRRGRNSPSSIPKVPLTYICAPD